MHALADTAERRADRIAGVVLLTFVVVFGAAGAGLLYAADRASADDAYWSSYPSMTYPRAWPGVVVLSGGDVLVVGGLSASGPMASTEIFDVDDGL